MIVKARAKDLTSLPRPRCSSPRPEHEVLKVKDLALRTHQSMFRLNIDTAALCLNHNYLNLHSLKTVTYRKNAKGKGKARISVDIKDLIVKAKASDLTANAKAKDLIAKAKTNTSRPRP